MILKFALPAKTLIFFSLILLNLACSKDSTTKPPKSPDQILTSRTWKIVEDRGLFNNSIINYQRGRSLNSQNLDGDSIQFNGDGTGIQWSGNPATSIPARWHFINDQKNLLSLTLNFSSTTSLEYQWEFIKLAEDSLKYNSSYNAFGNSDFETVVRIPN